MNELFLVHKTYAKGTERLCSIRSMIYQLSFSEFLRRFEEADSRVHGALKDFVSSMSAEEFYAFLKKLIGHSASYTDREQKIADTILKVLNSFSTVEELLFDPSRSSSIFFYVVDSLFRYRQLEPHGSEYRIVIAFDREGAHKFHQKYSGRYILYDSDALSGTAHKYYNLLSAFDFDYSKLPHPPELQFMVPCVKVSDMVEALNGTLS